MRVINPTEQHGYRSLSAVARVVSMGSVYCDNPNGISRSRLETFVVLVTTLRSGLLRCDAYSLGGTYGRFGLGCCLHFQNERLDNLMQMLSILLETFCVCVCIYTWGVQVVRYPNFFLGNGSR